MKDIYKGQVLKLIQWKFDQIVADRRVTSSEDAQLHAMAENLGVTLQHDPKTEALYERFKLLAQIEDGHLPTINPGIMLQRGEVCHASLVCSHNEIRKQTQLDSGTLYVTSKRLLFDGAQKSTSIALKKIIRFTVFSDGIKIDKDTGRD